MNVRNRKCIQRLSWRSLWGAKNRNIIAIIAIVLTTMMIASVFTIVVSMNSSNEMYSFRQIGGYCHGSFKDLTEQQIKEISAHPNIKSVGRRLIVGYMGDDAFAKVPAEISYMDENTTEWSFVTPVKGHTPKAEKDITMDVRALKLLGIEPELGAKVELTYLAGGFDENSYEKTDTFTLVGWWEYDNIAPVHFINVSEDYAKKMQKETVANGVQPHRVDLSIMTSSSINIYDKMMSVAEDLGYKVDLQNKGNGVGMGVNWGYTASVLDMTDVTLISGIGAILPLIIFTGYLTIYNIFQISVNGDIRFYGLLKTIGVTPRQLRRIIRQQALLLCCVGVPVGLLLGYAVGACLSPTLLTSIAGMESSVIIVSMSPVIFIISALFSIITVLMSCHRPGKIAAKVSPVEATRYTEVSKNKKKSRATRGAKVYHMAFANLSRHKSKTVLVVISLSLAVVLLNLVFTFTNSFDIEKYLDNQSCADFIVSSTEYFRDYSDAKNYITDEQVAEIEANTKHTLSGCGYTLTGEDPIGWMSEELWRKHTNELLSSGNIQDSKSTEGSKDEMVSEYAQIEGLDRELFEKLTVVQGDIAPLFEENSNAIALVVSTDDHGNVEDLSRYPKVGSAQKITYVENSYYYDSRTGENVNEQTPQEFVEHYMEKSNELDYTICAYVILPTAMSHRYYNMGYRFVLPVESLREDSKQEVVPMLYLFDTASLADEQSAEKYLAQYTSDELSGLMYESKASLRENFESFRNFFVFTGGLLCTVIGVVGILNFFNAIMTSVIARKREFAVLQAVGMTNKQLKTMLIYESMFYTLGSVLIALVLSVALNPLVCAFLEKIFWFVNAEFTILPVLLVIPVFALIGWLIPMILYNQTSKYSIVDRLRDN